ncbi:MAG: helix-turn-helix domain-containing protein [Acinetobacter populi]|jgi:DNA-binding transcriptional regulator YdaS (Cro superfamily)|uniref:transcriptional regulator n=1 Tax=Acinetobacter populi TaxID=1582270 RepID=UPI002355F9E8|nr:Cro/CI family transcriptional regulator [Acinetobacter populi]MCH4247614.1 helix-turn-helix domain-containing protein [Acinetobacter populi]
MQTPDSAFKKAIKIAGNKSALARKIGVTPWALSKWNVEKIPEERCEKIEEVTNGQVKAQDLRPDINWDYLRSTKNSNATTI